MLGKRLGCLMALTFLSGLGSACGDDDGGGNDLNQNQNNGNGNVAVCGNGEREGVEECDEGAANSDTLPDACRSDCRLAYCGDSVTDSDEGCDDGAANSNTEPNACRTTCDLPSCGDYVIDTDIGETCDNGPDVTTDTCDATCQVTSEFCGNGVVEEGEACDDGEQNGVSPNPCRLDCQFNTCGDAYLGGAEACDYGSLNGVTPNDCRSDCQLTWCGDGYVGGLEACDASGLNGVSPSACRDDCTLTTCGDGYVGGLEECDASELNGVSPSACRDDCLLTTCGDGYFGGSKECEDGSNLDDDGCSSDCEVEAGWTCDGTSPTRCVPGLFVAIDASAFMMGSPESELGRETIETQHLVTLTHDFALQTTEVTQEQFQKIMGYNPSHFVPANGHASCPTCPVEYVSWHEAARYCNALSERAGLDLCFACTGSAPDFTCAWDTVYDSPYHCPGFRLPTEAEKEYAARAGTTTATYNGDLDASHLVCEADNTVLDPIAWFCANNASSSPKPVGQKLANAWGLFDLLGNVGEWLYDWSDDYPGDETDPWGPTTGTLRANSGGRFNNYAQQNRAAYRFKSNPTFRVYNLGFRPARTLNP